MYLSNNGGQSKEDKKRKVRRRRKETISATRIHFMRFDVDVVRLPNDKSASTLLPAPRCQLLNEAGAERTAPENRSSRVWGRKGEVFTKIFSIIMQRKENLILNHPKNFFLNGH